MKKKIFIEAHYLEIGGAEISLIGLLNAIDYSKYEVDLFLCEHRGDLLHLVPKEVNILLEVPEYAQLEKPIKKVIKSGFWKIAFGRLKARLLYLLWSLQQKDSFSEGLYEFVDRETVKYLPSLYHLGHYDLALNFISAKSHIPSKVLANRTATWIHTDIGSANLPSIEYNRWDAFDFIVSISEEVSNSFLKIFPNLKDKIILIENILSREFIENQSKEAGVSFDTNDINLLSIGRFCYAKNYDNVPDIAKLLVKRGIKNLKWYIIGFGPDENFIKEKIKEAQMENHVIMLGKKNNPYPYIKACDIYVQPSRYEGKSVTVREAQMLNKPVAVTNYPTATSQVKSGIDGIIVPMDNEGCANALASFIENKKLRKQLSENCKSKDFSNIDEVNKIYSLLTLS